MVRIVSNILNFELMRALEYIQVYGLKSKNSLLIIQEISEEANTLDVLVDKLLTDTEI